MNIINDTKFSFGWIVGKIKPPQLAATFIVKGSFLLKPDLPAVQSLDQESPQGDVHFDDDPTRSLYYESDFAKFKPCADLLLVGTCYPPEHKATGICRVTFGVASWAKSLAVMGKRVWESGPIGKKSSLPQSFLKMALVYENSFGGASYEKNPCGKGLGTLELPNIEDPNLLLSNYGEVVNPAGFAPIVCSWAQRREKVGNYGGTWLKERWPWFPDDFDWTYFNAAPYDQQLKSYLRGDEEIYFENLHPKFPLYRSWLPGLRVRCFLKEKTGDSETFREVKLNLDTLWIDMDDEKLVLVWRGISDIRSVDMKDILDILVVAEQIQEPPLPAEKYESFLAQGQANKDDIEIEEDYPSKDDLENNNSGLENSEKWKEGLAQATKELEDEIAAIESELVEKEKSLMNSLAQAGYSPSIFYAASGATLTDEQVYQQYKIALEQQKSAFPEFAHGNLSPLSLEDIQGPAPSKKFELEQGIADPPHWTRELCLEHALAGHEFLQQDLSGLDLSGLNFNGVVFVGSVLNGANLSKAKFVGANFSSVDLTRADLSQSDLRKAVFIEADLSGATLVRAKLVDAILENATLAEAKLMFSDLANVSASKSDFSSADLSGAFLENATFDGSDLSMANLNQAIFKNASLREASIAGASGREIDMEGADLTGLIASENGDFTCGNFKSVLAHDSIWEESILEEADFTCAKLSKADFTSAVLTRACFLDADLRYARFDDVKLERANLQAVNLFQGSFERASLKNTNLSKANLYEVEFYEAIIDSVNFQDANLKNTKLS